METVTIKRKPSVIYQDGKPTAVILELEDYEAMLEKLEDFEDLQALESIRKQRPPEYTPLEDYLKELGIEDV